MEPERKIEKWLKAYAKKRRTQASEPFNLHPATRRLLQSEVARDKPKPDDDDESVSLWEVIRQQWALLLSFAACIFLVGIIALPFAYYTAKNKSRSLGIASATREVGSSANRPAVAASDQVAASLGDKKDMTPARNDLNDREINPGSNTLDDTNGIPSPTVAMTVTPSAAPGVSHSIGVTPLEVSPGSSAVPPAKLPSSEQNAGTFSQQLKSESEIGSVASRRLGELQNAFKNSIEPSQANPVLANFQVLQNGNAIRLVDQDGSIYNGWLQLANQAVEKIQSQSGLNNTDTRLLQNSVTMAAGLPSQQVTAAQDALQIAQNYFFHVYGTNRTTKQTVSFTGSLGANVVATNASKLAFGSMHNTGGGGFGGGGGGGGGGEVAIGSSFDQTKSVATNQVGQLPWADLRITGTAVVNQTNRIQVNAAPVAPNKN